MFNYAGNTNTVRATESQRDLEGMISRNNKNIKLIKDIIRSLDKVSQGDNYTLREMRMMEGYGMLHIDLKNYKRLVKSLLKEQDQEAKGKKGKKSKKIGAEESVW